MANQYISGRLKQARIAAGMTQKDVYQRLKIGQSTFSAWETGVAEPGIIVFLQLEAPEEADIGIRISGDSMEPKIHDGEIVFVKYQPSVEENEIGIFVLNGDAYCKRLGIEDGKPVLRSLNAKYRPIYVGDNDQLVTYGKVLL